MAPKRTFSESQALALYHEHKNDREIAEILNANRATIACWRKRKNLPTVTEIGTHYTNALNPREAKEMRKFLSTLVWADKKAKEAGIKPDITRFIEIYSGRYKTEEEKRTEHTWVCKQSKARRGEQCHV